MADFKTHMTVSTTLGAGLGAWAFFQGDFRWSTSMLAAGLCSVGGMLPDLDSDPGRPLRETISLTAATVPVMTVERMHQFGWDPEQIILACIGIYFAIRFGMAELLRRYTVHRGMFHSLPAMLIAGELVFLLGYTGELRARHLFAGGVMAGFFSHLALDELWSLDPKRLRVKSSFGTALKLWGDSMWANLSTYGKLAFLSYIALNDPNWMGRLERGWLLDRLGRPIERLADLPGLRVGERAPAAAATPGAPAEIRANPTTQPEAATDQARDGNWPWQR